MPHREHELLTLAVSGDRDALGELLESHIPMLRAQLAEEIPSRHRAVLSADDVVQQTLVDAFLDISRFMPHGPDAFAAFLMTIAHRNLIDAIRGLDAAKRGRDRTQSATGDPDASFWCLFETIMGTGSTPSMHAAKLEAQHHLEQSINRLPEQYQTVVRMYDLDEAPATLVAKALDRGTGAMFMLRARAHRKLMEIMGSPSRFLHDFS